MTPAANQDTSTPRLKVAGLSDDFKEAWNSTFATNSLSEAEGRIDGVENTVDAATQKRYQQVNEFYNANADTIKSAVTIIDARVSIKDLENVLHDYQKAAGILVKGLDELAKLHPFIQVAIIPFKLIYALDSTRRDNNQKVLAIKVQMKEMMLSLFRLRHVKDSEDVGPDGTSISGRMQSLMQDIAKDIRECGSACDAYLKKGFLAKTFKSKFYEPVLASYGDRFVKRTNEIMFALSVHTAVGVDNANLKLDVTNEHMQTVEEKIDTLLLFRKLDSPRELELQRFIRDNGGIKACIDNDKLLEELMEKDDSLRQPSQDFDKALKEAREQLNKELSEDVGLTLKRNFEIFERKLEAQSLQIDSLHDTIHDEGEHIISVIMSGSYDNILDKDLQRIWQAGGWKGSSVKARHFVLTLYDYYSEHQDQVVESSVASPITAIDNPPHTPSGNLVSPVPHLNAIVTNLAGKALRLKHQRWALSYVNVAHLQPIIEAIDDDGTGFVTIKEVNVFATSRPEGWSLLHWLAYWASGWHLSLTKYHCRVHSLLRQLFTSYKYVLPANKSIVVAFLDSWPIKQIEHLLRSTQLRNGSIMKREEEEQLAKLVDSYESQEKRRMEEVLQTIAYNIDTQPTVALITGPGRIERLLFPLLHLLLKQHLNIIILGSAKILASEELFAPLTSLRNVLSVVNERVAGLNAIFKQTSPDVKPRFSHFAYGMFALTSEGVIRERKNNIFARPPDNPTLDDSAMPEDSFEAHIDVSHSLDAGMLKPLDDLDSEFQAYELDRSIQSFSLPQSQNLTELQAVSEIETGVESHHPVHHLDDESVPHAEIQGVWTTQFTFWMDDQYLTTWLSTVQMGIKLTNPSSGDYSITGIGQTMDDAYDITGMYFPASRQVAMTMKNARLSEYSLFPLIRASVDFENGIIGGYWVPVTQDDPDIDAYLDEGYNILEQLIHYPLTLVRTPAHLYRFRVTPNRGVLGLARSRWFFALGAVLYEVRRKMWSWSVIKHHCTFRRRYLHWRTETTASGFYGVDFTDSMRHPQPLWDYRRLRPDIPPADAQLYLQAYLGANLPNSYRPRDFLPDLAEKAAETCPQELLKWCRVWSGHLFSLQVTGELNGWQGFFQFVLSEFVVNDSEVDCVLVKGEGQNQHGVILITGRYGISSKTMTLNMRFPNVSSVDATMNYVEETDTIAGKWKLLPGLPTKSPSDTELIVGYSTTTMTLYFSRTEASIFQYRPGPDPPQHDRAIAQNRNLSRLRWSFAIEATLHQVRQKLWSWNYFKTRATTRRNFVDLVKRERMEGHSAFNIIDRAWDQNSDDPSWIVAPAESNSYRGRILAEYRALQIHSGYSCDSCHRGLLTTRLFCLTCVSDDLQDSDEIDLCEICAEETLARDSFKHVSSHPLLKCPEYLYDHQYSWAIQRGREVWERARKTLQESAPAKPSGSTVMARPVHITGKATDKPVSSCSFCRTVVELSFWVCIECATDVYICPSCALRNPKTLKMPESTTHLTRHMIIRVQRDDSDGIKVVRHEEAQNSRLDILENKLVEFQSHLNDLKSSIQGDVQPRLEKLEGSMGRIEKMLSMLAKRFELEGPEKN